jgi:hypothetical protein
MTPTVLLIVVLDVTLTPESHGRVEFRHIHDATVTVLGDLRRKVDRKPQNVVGPSGQSFHSYHLAKYRNAELTRIDGADGAADDQIGVKGIGEFSSPGRPRRTDVCRANGP